MPVVTVNLPPSTYSEIMDLVGQGLYANPEQFLATAAFNQVALERGTPITEIAPGQTADVDPSRSLSKAENRQQRRPVAKQRAATMPIDRALETVMKRFALEHLADFALNTAPSVAEPTEEHIWGLVNRLFPLKLAIRSIAVIAQQRGQWPEIAAITDQLASDAALVGTALERADTERQRTRDDALAIGLPRMANLQSRDRYVSQFIARVTRSGHIYPGAIVQYNFGSFENDRVILTDRALLWARIENPVLEGSPFTCQRTLSEEEKNFLLRHIAELVPSERKDFVAIIRAIQNGNSTPESLLATVRKEFPMKWSDLELRTHTYGVLARLADLGLIGKLREGRRVQYTTGEQATRFVA